MQVNLEFPIEKVEKAIQTPSDVFDSDRLNDRVICIPLKEGKNSMENPTCVFMKDKVMEAYQNALDEKKNTVTIEYDAPSKEMFRKAGFVKEGDTMVHKKEKIIAKLL